VSPPSPSTLPEALQRRKDEAEVRTAEANARKAEVEADKAADAAERERLTALVPDLSKVKDSTLDVKDATPMWSTLTFAALKKVGQAVADDVLAQQHDAKLWRVLVTDEAELATSDAVHQEVTTGLEQLVAAADKLLEDVRELVATTIAALAAALPGVLSLLSSRRTVSTAATAAGDLAAAAAVAGALRERSPDVAVVHDDFRLIAAGGVYAKLADVSDRRQKLVAKKLDISAAKSEAEVGLSEAKAAEPRDEAAVAMWTKKVQDAAARLGLIDSVITAIDTFVSAIRAVPKDATRSLLTTAALRDALHEGMPFFTHVLLVKGQPGQAQQQLDNRPLWFKDRFSTVADTSITYALIETGESKILTSGTVSGMASARGEIGERWIVDPPVVSGQN
jgi:hypothetical protein